MALNNFSDVQRFFDDFLDLHRISVAGAPHKAFWKGVPGDVDASREKFVNGNVPGLRSGDPPVKILIKGDSEASNIIKILRAGGLPPLYPRMPKNSSQQFYSDAQIQELADWIDGLDADGDDDA